MNTTRNRAQRRLMHSAAVGVLGVALIAAAGTAFALSESARDEFSSISYGGNNGTLDWTGSWTELGESDGPSAGVIDVAASNRCAADNCLRMGGDAADVNGRGVWREVNLANASSAVLTFSYRRERTGSTGASSVGVAVSGNAGESWTTLGTYNFGGPEAMTDQSFDITFYASSETRIRFLATGVGVKGYLHFDDIEIAAVFPDAPTTTTTSAPGSTTTTSTPTTTSAPGSTTTTSAPGSTTTTSTPGLTTTTTAPGGITNATTPPSDSGGVDGDPGHLSPIKGLTVAFRTTVEALGESALSIVALGILVGCLSILGLDRRVGNRPASRQL